MTVYYTPNNVQTRDAIVPPPTLKEDGTPVKWRMFYDGNSTIADSDSVRELVSVLIESYLSMETDEQRYALREEYLRNLRFGLRAQIAASVSSEDWEKMDTTERFALTHEDKYGPDFNMGDGEPFIWKYPYPLILVKRDYVGEDTNRVAPLSDAGDANLVHNIIYLHNETEREFLNSLHRVGHIAFGRPRVANRVPKNIRTN